MLDSPRFRQPSPDFEAPGRGHRHVGSVAPAARERHIVTAAAVATLVAGMVSAYGAYSSAQAQANAADYNRKVAKNQATATQQAADIEAENKADQYRRIMAAQRAGIGASGVEASEGSPLLTQIETAGTAALNVKRIHYQGQVGAQRFNEEAVLQGYYGRTARTAGYINAGASLLSGVANAGGIYAKSKLRQPDTTYPDYL